jgi:hypothetical protein
LEKCILNKGETEVVVPSKVRIIGQGAFFGCTKMETVILPDKLEEIVAYAFEGCKSLKKIEIPQGVKNIGMGAFMGCSGLADEKGMVIIRDTLYGYWGEGEEVTVPEGVAVIGAYAFENREVTEVSLPESLKRIDNYAFTKCRKLRKINFPSNLRLIGASAFDHCGSLEEIAFPDKLEIIELAAFADCGKLTDAVIPSSVTKMEGSVFSSCKKLKSVSFSQRDHMICVGKYLDDTDILLPEGWIEKENPEVLSGWNCVKSIVLPDGIEEISTNAFSWCGNLKTVILSAGLKAIRHFNGFYSPFNHCNKLRYVIMPRAFSAAKSKNPQTVDCACVVMAKEKEIPIFFMNSKPEELAVQMRKPACYAFAAMVADGVEMDAEIEKAYLVYIKKNKNKFKPEADKHYGLKQLLG